MYSQIGQKEAKHWGIVGGGILGMTLALRLAQQGQKVTLFEAAEGLGGLASAWNLGNIVWDRHYHVTLLSDLRLRALLTELGLEQEMQWVETKTGFYTNGKLYSMSNTLEFLKFPPLGWLGKLRLGLTIIYASKIKNWRRLETIPIADWLKKLSGKSTFEKIWLPLLRAKLGENYRQASASFIWAIIARMYAARRTGLKKEMFGYLPGGYARILARLGDALVAAGVDVKVGHRVQCVEGTGDRLVKVQFTNGHQAVFDQTVLTMAAPIAAQVCEGLSRDELDRLKGLQYQGIICASLILKQSLAHYYVTNITDAWVPFTAVIEMSALVDRSAFAGNHLIYLPKYVDPQDPAFELSDAQLQEQFVQAIERMYPHFRREDVLEFRVSRVRYVLAISTLNYSQRLPSMHTTIPGLHIVNSAHILNGTLNVNETIQLAENSVNTLLNLARVGINFP